MITITTLIFVFLTGFSTYLANPETVYFDSVGVPQGPNRPGKRAERVSRGS